MKNKNNTWIKVVVAIIILELLVGAIIFAYKKIYKPNDNSISVKDKEVVALYNKIAYYDIESLDVMSPKTMLYYGYKNVSDVESINCDVVSVTDNTDGYSCTGIASFVPSETLNKSVKNIYGPDVIIEYGSFEVDKNHYAFYDTVADGYVIYTKNEEVEIDPVNLKLKQAFKDDDGNIIITVDILDGIFGTNIDTYNFTFSKNGKNYYLTSKELIKK